MGYIEDHPTHFNWNRETGLVVAHLQAAYPFLTWVGTYHWHPPFDPPNITRMYDAQSFDVWGGGRSLRGKYKGYRGKPLRPKLGDKIFDDLWEGRFGGPLIAWIIYRGDMWIRGVGWGPAPPGAADSDPGHFNHIHVTFMPF